MTLRTPVNRILAAPLNMPEKCMEGHQATWVPSKTSPEARTLPRFRRLWVAIVIN